MAEVRRYTRTKTNWTPVSYTANESATAIINVNANECIHEIFVRTRVVFNGAGTDAILTIGDDGDADRFVKDGDVDETTTGLYMAIGGAGSTYSLLGRHLYTAANTIDITFTANTSGTRTTGAFDIIVVYSKVVPNNS